LLKLWQIERGKLPEPKHKGQKITNLHCACGWCEKTHAYVIADYVKLDDKQCLLWIDKSPCVDKIVKQVLRRL